MGARLGEWSDVYGSRATRKKVYSGKVTNWFGKIGVAEILIESASLKTGDRILIMGPTTGVVEMTVPEIRVDLKPVDEAGKGCLCSVPVDASLLESCEGRLRRSDKVYVWEKTEQQPQ